MNLRNYRKTETTKDTENTKKLSDLSALSGLPNGWSWVKLGDVCQILDSKRIPINSSERQKRISGKSEKELYPYYGATGQVGLIDDYIFEGEHILVGEDGAPFLDVYKDKAYLVNGKFWVNNHAHILIFNGINKFLCFYLNFLDYKPFVTGTTRLKLNQSSLKQIPIKNPPLTEQRRIVEKIEELFSELDNGIENLKKSKEQIKTYRQAVLKFAFEGKLVQGKSSKAKVKSENSELKEGWEWRKLGDISDIINGYAFKSKDFSTEGHYQVIKIGNVRPINLRLEEKPAFVSNIDQKIKNKYLLRKNDLVISLTGTRKKRDYGFVALVKHNDRLLLNQRLAAIRLKGKYNPMYFLYLLSVNIFLDQFFSFETGNVGQGNVGPLCLY